MASFKERINILWEEAKDSDYRTTQTEFADKFGASRSQLQGWLDGRGEPDTEMLKVIAEKCNVSVDWLVGNADIRLPYGVIDITEQIPESIRKEYELDKVLAKVKDGVINAHLRSSEIETMLDALIKIKKQGS